eukprot:SAG11_NODE_1878_length_4131_cov_81.001984_1_plen_1376_part_11
MWYALYGETLTRSEVFEEKMLGLCRELGERGKRVKLSRGAGVKEAGGGASADADGASLGRDSVLAVLKGGEHGGAAAGLLCSALVHVVRVLDGLSTTTPRRSRKGMLELIERAETVCDSIDAAWCEGLSRCAEADIEALSVLVVGVNTEEGEGEFAGTGASFSAGVSELLESLGRLGSAAVQSLSVLRAEHVEGDEEGRVWALEVLRGLSPARLEEVSSQEVSAVDAVVAHMEGAEVLGIASRAVACMALFTLGCRNGFAICCSKELIDLTSALIAESYSRLSQSMQGAARDVSERAWAERDFACASSAMFNLVILESSCKATPAVRAELKSCHAVSVKAFFGTAKSCFTDRDVGAFVDHVAEHQLMLNNSDLQLASGCTMCVYLMIYTHEGMAKHGEEAGLFRDAWELYSLLCPAPLDADWWVSTCDVVDVTSVNLCALANMLDLGKVLDDESRASAPWWLSTCGEAIRLAKLNVSAGLMARGTIWFGLIKVFSVLEVAARGAQRSMLLDSGVIDALEYACLHGFDWLNGLLLSMSFAAGAAVVLVGMNEGGKTLSRGTVFAVLSALSSFFEKDSFRAQHGSLEKLCSQVARIAAMAVSDVNKALMLEFSGLIDTLLKCLLLDSPRRLQTGGDVLEEATVGVLESLALFGPSAEALRAHGLAMKSLRRVASAGTEVSRRSAKAALFQLEGIGSGHSAPAARVSGTKHVMVSYCWEQQPTILRVVAAVQSRGYLIWVDVEQMTGSTVDSMALAVEAAEVMLIGVSRQYKESTNCRLEAQYAMQREVPTVPLMLVDGYRADGWLGMLIGTRMWYGFYGAVLSEDGLFEAKVSELCRDLGDRGRRQETSDGIGLQGEDEGASENPAIIALRLELRGLKLNQLRKRALANGGGNESVEAAMDAEEPKAALIDLLVELDLAEDLADDSMRAELSGLKMSEIRKRAVAAGATSADVDAADESEDPKSFWIERLMALSVSAAGHAQVSGLVSMLGGADSSVAATRLEEVLERGAELLDAMLVSTKRKARRPLQQLLDSVEAEAERLARAGGEGCAHLQQCTIAGLEELAESVLEVEGLKPAAGIGAETVMDAVRRLISCIASCGDVVLQSVCVLRSSESSGVATILVALEVLCDLERVPEVATESELSVVPVVAGMICDLDCGGVERDALRCVASVALHTLYIRVGRPIVHLESSTQVVGVASAEAYSLHKDGRTRLAGCVGSLYLLLTFEFTTKVPRPNPLLDVFLKNFKVFLNSGSILLSGDIKRLVGDSRSEFERSNSGDSARRSNHDDALLMGFAGLTLTYLTGCTDSATEMAAACQRGWFREAMNFHRVRVGSRLPTSFWVEHATITTDHTTRLGASLLCMHSLPKSGLKDYSPIAT